MMFEYLNRLGVHHRDAFFDEYIVRPMSDDEHYVGYGDWFSEMHLYQFSDTMLTNYAALRTIYSALDYYGTRMARAQGTNPTFQQLLASLEGEVGDPDQEVQDF